MALEELLRKAQPIAGWDNYYITSCGKVLSTKYKKPRLLRTNAVGTKRQYLTVCLSRPGVQKREYIHQLVAKTFHGERPEGQCVRHLDGNSINNDMSNLTWGTWSANSMDRYDHGTMLVGSSCPMSKTNEKDVKRMRQLYEDGWTQQRIADRFGLSFQNVSRIVRRELWAHVL